MKPIQTVCITTRRPHDAADPGECAIIYYRVDGNAVKVTDRDSHMLRYSDGQPCKQALEPDDNPRQIAARLGRHTVKLSMNPAVKLRSGGMIAGTRCRDGKGSLMFDTFRST
jgi:hypothetical protein